MRMHFLIFLIALFNATALVGQIEIELVNPSFEDIPRAGQQNGYAIKGWHDCNEPGQTFVDVQPGFFEVDLPPNDGKTYVGMVVRASGKVEGVTQKLASQLITDQHYVMSIDLARANNYISHDRTSGKEENFNTPVVLKVFGAATYCGKNQLLFKTSPIVDQTWTKHYLKFQPDAHYSFLTIIVDYEDTIDSPYNGNLLIDNLSTIYAVDEDTDPEAFFNN